MRWERIGLIWACMMSAFFVHAADTQCAVCGNVVRGRYLVANDRSYCSQQCFRTILPKCHICQRTMDGTYTVSDGHKFCSRRCLNEVLPACELCHRKVLKRTEIDGHVYCREHGAGPRCGTCQLPFIDGGRLSDGRKLCAGCKTNAIFDLEVAQPVFERASRRLRKLTNLRASLPAMKLVGRDQLGTLSGSHRPANPTTVRGFYHRKEVSTTMRSVLGRVLEDKVDVTKTIYLLYGLSPEALEITAVHELMHDLIATHFPEIAESPEWFEEGLCQYAAAMVARRMGYTDELEAIETAPDPIYGDGYRYFKQRLGTRPWTAVEAWLRRVEVAKVPRVAPKGRRGDRITR